MTLTIKAKKLYAFILKYNIGLLSLIFLLAAAQFYREAERIRLITKPNNPDAFGDGDIVRVIDVIDGDEVLIEKDGTQTNLRILGIKSFNSTLSDPTVTEYGRICLQYLQSTTKNQKAKIKIPTKRVGGEGRLLGTLFLADQSGQYRFDLGEDLISKGYSMVYSRYDFDLMIKYLKVENQTKLEKKGFWGNETISNRVIAMKKIWEEEKLID
ncbi:thermonuclease family protein [bacterium]|nr:thermonuclease family protein [Akkermansiaceae bacterium]MDA7523240.1 thermonuclease family protein [bacterium]MDB4618880.1 thermonuclease family protein [bacterium]MDB4629415.1 thermonuclease family protein [bacterium]MDC0295208.1 thermonuclease family protein [bacterium]